MCQPNENLHHKVGKMILPNFDGSRKLTAHSWIQKLDTYLSLSPMIEEDAIKFAILHLEGVAHDWWHHGLITQGHQNVTTFDDFTGKLFERFDQKYPERYFKELTQFRQQGSVEDYVAEFQIILGMVAGVTKVRLTYLFIEGLMEPLHGLVGALDPTSLQDGIKKALRLEITTKVKTYTKNIPSGSHKQPFDEDNLQPKALPPLSNKEEESVRELRNKNLCFHYREPWKLGHQCFKRGQVCHIEAITNGESKEEFEPNNKKRKQRKEVILQGQ